MDFRVVLQDLNGVARGELYRVHSARWAYVLNGYGGAEIGVDSDDPAAISALLTKSARMVIYADEGNWGGVLKRLIKQSGNTLSIGAWSNEKLLQSRVTAKTRSFSGYTSGIIAQTLLNETNALWPTGVAVGAIYTAGVAHDYEIHYEDLLERFKSMASTDDHDFEVTWDRILNWYERKGSDKPNVVLAEGRNVVKWPTYRYDETMLTNDQFCIGSGVSWTEKITANAFDITNQYKYGLWQRANTFGSISVQSTLDLRAETFIEERKDPKRTVDLTIVDRPTGLWASFTEGDRVRVVLPSYHFGEGFDEMMKVTAREINAVTGTMRVTVELS